MPGTLAVLPWCFCTISPPPCASGHVSASPPLPLQWWPCASVSPCGGGHVSAYSFSGGHVPAASPCSCGRRVSASLHTTTCGGRHAYLALTLCGGRWASAPPHLSPLWWWPRVSSTLARPSHHHHHHYAHLPTSTTWDGNAKLQSPLHHPLHSCVGGVAAWSEGGGRSPPNSYLVLLACHQAAPNSHPLLHARPPTHPQQLMRCAEHVEKICQPPPPSPPKPHNRHHRHTHA